MREKTRKLIFYFCLFTCHDTDTCQLFLLTFRIKIYAMSAYHHMVIPPSTTYDGTTYDGSLLVFKYR